MLDLRFARVSVGALTACRECDLLQRLRPVAPGSRACCPRCGATLLRGAAPDANNQSYAYTLAACVLFVIANSWPIMGLDIQGTHNSTTLMGAVRALWNDDSRAVAALVFITTVLVPAAELAGLSWVLMALRRGTRGRSVVALLHFLESVKPWGMVEVFVLGILVSLVKLTHIAQVEPGAALYSFGALMLCIAAAAASFDADAAWSQLEQAT